ncbi:MAG TPA: CHAT domain-containing protein, partial [Acidobacteriota bacterium]
SASAWVRWSEAGAPRRRAPVLVVGDPLGDLPGARSEARAVARCFDGSRLLLGSQATPAAVLAALSAAGLAHVAAHYRLELSNPYQSELLLARADGRGPAPLSMARLSRRALPLRPLIVLSSCSAAGGPFHPGEGVVGGFRALFEAGASGVIAPLEPVADLSTARLMRDLAAELEAGHPPDLALARAQRAALARGGRRSSPDWARFIFIGGAA